MTKKTLLLLTPLLLFSKPVKVDEILTEQNKLKLDMSISYSNINKKAGVTAPISYETMNGDFVNIPTYVGISSSNQDYINYGFNLKYGISEKLEVFTNLNLFTSDTHISDSEFSSKSEKGFNNLNLGLTYQVKKEDDKPSLLIGGSVDLIERVTFSGEHKEDLNFKSYSFFATSYYTVDPIVFLLKAGYRLNLEKKYKDENINSGDIFTLSPNIYFAVNPYTSINWGIRYQFKGKDRIDKNVVSNSGSSVSYLFGVSYEINSKYTFNLDTEKKDTNDYSSNNINLALSYKF
jgi:hypothetical protein